MKKTTLALFSLLVLLSACSKKEDTPVSNESGVMEAKIDGKYHKFNVVSGTLLRSPEAEQKRVDITGTSEDGSVRLILTFGEDTHLGDGLTLKTYILQPFRDEGTEGFTTYSTSMENGGWLTLPYHETGSLTLIKSNIEEKVISAHFETTLTRMSDESKITKITEGKITNVKYIVVN